MWLILLGGAIACIGYVVVLERDDIFNRTLGWSAAFLAGVMMMIPLVPRETGQYYMPAEIAAQNAYNTYFASEDGNVFVSEIRPWHDMDSPYLLCMDTMGTTQVEDDEILVVWRTE